MFLSQEQMWDRPLGGTSRDKQIPHWFGNLTFVCVGLVLKLLFRYRVDKRENLRAFKDRSGAVVVCNHTSFFDVVFIYLAGRPSQWVRLMGRESLFDNAGGFMGQMLTRVGSFPVKRDSADRSAIKRATRMLKNGELVGILPEGTRRGKGSQIPKLHAGAAFIAKLGKVPILPMTVRNAEYIKQKGRWVHFPKVTIEYGDPIVVEDFDFLPKADRLEACTWYAMRECFALSQRVAPEEVPMQELFPESRDFSEAFLSHSIPRRTVEEAICVAQGIPTQNASTQEVSAAVQNGVSISISSDSFDNAALNTSTSKEV